MRHTVSLFGILLVLGYSSLAWADDVDDFVQRQMENRHAPGLALLVVKDGPQKIKRIP